MVYTWIIIAGPITGAHFNPALTLSIWICSWNVQGQFLMSILYHVAGFLGGLAGVALSYLALRNCSQGQELIPGCVKPEFIVSLHPADNISYIGLFIIEVVATFWFCFINLTLKTRATSPINTVVGAVAAVVNLLLCIEFSISKTGACLNPAFALA